MRNSGLVRGEALSVCVLVCLDEKNVCSWRTFPYHRGKNDRKRRYLLFGIHGRFWNKTVDCEWKEVTVEYLLLLYYY
jgi:hypothetical protein